MKREEFGARFEDLIGFTPIARLQPFTPSPFPDCSATRVSAVARHLALCSWDVFRRSRQRRGRGKGSSRGTSPWSFDPASRHRELALFRSQSPARCPPFNDSFVLGTFCNPSPLCSLFRVAYVSGILLFAVIGRSRRGTLLQGVGFIVTRPAAAMIQSPPLDLHSPGISRDTLERLH